MPTQIPSWSDFSDHPVFDNLTNINDFAFSVEFPRYVDLSRKRNRQRLSTKLYREMFTVIGEIGLENLHAIARADGLNSAGSTYEDDDFGFSVRIDSESTMRLHRPGSSFERFFEWYYKVMPKANQFVKAVSDELQPLVAQNPEEMSIDPVRVVFDFKFLLHSFKAPNRRKKVRNSRMVQPVIGKVPSSEGSLVSFSDSELRDMGRVDVAISRWHQSPIGDDIRERYSIEAPSNRDYGAVWLSFGYIGETRSVAESDRKTADLEKVIEQYSVPLQDFVRDRCIVSFLADLTGGLAFESSHRWLP